MKSFLKKVLPGNIKSLRKILGLNLCDDYSTKSYSQEGEDMILRRLFERQSNGFYVDVGAHHPARFSNTYFFYKKGWWGINIDATPGSMALFNEIRPRDINIEAAVAREKKEMTFFMFNEPALNSFDDKLVQSRNKEVYSVEKKQIMATKTLEEIIAKNLPEDQKISFLSVDVEGLDLEVLQSNNWLLYRPKYVLVECLHLNLVDVKENDVYSFLNQKNYEIFAKTFNTVLFRDKQLL